MNCLPKSKKLSENQEGAVAEDYDFFKELEEQIENLRSIQSDLFSENMDAASFTDVDEEVLAAQPHLLKLIL